MNTTLKKVAQATLGDLPLGSVLVMSVGVAYATALAQQRYGTQDLSTDVVPESLRDFLADIVAGAEEYLNELPGIE